MPADAVIMAFGFHPHRMPGWRRRGGAGQPGRIKAGVESRYRYQTSQEKIFAGGDAVRGADLVVTAMAEGRHAAQGIWTIWRGKRRRFTDDKPGSAA